MAAWNSRFLSFTLELAIPFFDTPGHLVFGLRQLGRDLGVFSRNDLRGKNAGVCCPRFADGHRSDRNSRGHLHRRKQRVESFET